MDAGRDEERALVPVKPKKETYFSRLAAIQRKIKLGYPLDEDETRVIERHRLGLERVRIKQELPRIDRASRIAEMEVLKQMSLQQIGEKLGLSPKIARNEVWKFKKKHPDLMEKAYARVRRVVEMEQEARLLGASGAFASKTTAALDVFDDHLAGRKVGNLPPAVRQRAAEKVLEFVKESQKESRAPGGFDQKALGLISSRLKALRAKNDIPTTAEVISSEEAETVR